MKSIVTLVRKSKGGTLQVRLFQEDQYWMHWIRKKRSNVGLHLDD